MSEDVLPVVVIYHDPADYPGKYVVRRQVIDGGQIVVDVVPLGVVDDLDAARALVPPGMHRIPRSAEDEPQIVECWL